MTVSSPISDICFHLRMLSDLLISSCSPTNSAVISNICFKVRSLEFMLKFWIVEKFFPMNVAAFIVAAMNILQNIECSSPKSATFDIVLSTSCLVSYFIHKFCSVTSHDESFGICLFLGVSFIKFPRSSMNHLSVPYRLRISVEKRFFTMKDNLLHHIPIIFLTFSWSIERRSSSLPHLRRPRSTIPLLNNLLVTHHVWNSLWLKCLRVGFWCRCTWVGFWGPDQFDQTTNQEQLGGFWMRVSLWDFCL